MKWLAALTLVALTAYAVTGVYFVQLDENAVVRRFGAVDGAPREPGPHWGLPWRWDRIDRIKPHEVKQVTLGTASTGDAALVRGPAEFLTGDRNLINIEATVQYTIARPTDYLYLNVNLDSIVASAAEATLTHTLAGMAVDLALTHGKQQLATSVADRLQGLVRSYGLGILIRSVDIRSAEPPGEVADAFHKVTSAQHLREQQIYLAQSERTKLVEQAKGDSRRMANEAKAARDGLIQQARGKAAGFDKLLKQYVAAPDLTRREIYHEAMNEILFRLGEKLIVGSQESLDLSIFGKSPGSGSPRGPAADGFTP